MNDMAFSEEQEVVTISLNKIIHGNERPIMMALGKTKVDDEPFPLEFVLDLRGIENALWHVEQLNQRYKRAEELLICNIAESVLPIFEKERPDDKNVRRCIETRRSLALGDASDEEWCAARNATTEAVREVILASRDAEALATGDITWSDAAWHAARSAVGETALSAIQQATEAMEWDAEAEVEVEMELGVTRTIEQWFVEVNAAIQKGKAAVQEKQIALFRDFCNLRGDYKKCIRNDDPVVPTMG